MDKDQMIELKASLDLYQTQYGATDKLWTYFSTITLAVLGFSIGSDKVSGSFFEATLVVLGYLVFCVGNFQSLVLAQKQLIQFADLARSVAAKYDTPMSSLRPFSVTIAKRFYWAVVAAVCAGIMLITCHRGCG